MNTWRVVCAPNGAVTHEAAELARLIALGLPRGGTLYFQRGRHRIVASRGRAPGRWEPQPANRLTIPANVDLRFESGAILEPLVPVDIAGQIHAMGQRIFDISPPGLLRLDVRANPRLDARWWGVLETLELPTHNSAARIDPPTPRENADRLRDMLTSVRPGHTVIFAPGEYDLDLRATGPLRLVPGVRYHGAHATLAFHGATVALTLECVRGDADTVLHGFELLGDGVDSLLRATGPARLRLVRVRTHSAGFAGIEGREGTDLQLESCTLRAEAGLALHVDGDSHLEMRRSSAIGSTDPRQSTVTMQGGLVRRRARVIDSVVDGGLRLSTDRGPTLGAGGAATATVSYSQLGWLECSGDGLHVDVAGCTVARLTAAVANLTVARARVGGPDAEGGPSARVLPPRGGGSARFVDVEFGLRDDVQDALRIVGPSGAVRLARMRAIGSAATAVQIRGDVAVDAAYIDLDVHREFSLTGPARLLLISPAVDLDTVPYGEPVWLHVAGETTPTLVLAGVWQAWAPAVESEGPDPPGGRNLLPGQNPILERAGLRGDQVWTLRGELGHLVCVQSAIGRPARWRAWHCP